jgi:hypothetical protein
MAALVQEAYEDHLEPFESDHELICKMALKMAALLPNDPDQGAAVLALTTSLYAVLTESRAPHAN